MVRDVGQDQINLSKCEKVLDYQDVNKIRYEAVDLSNPEDNIYAPINPIGNYSYYAGYKATRWFLKKLSKHSKKRLHDLRIIDAGCGNGYITRIMAELTSNASNISGFDYSDNNIEYCKAMNFCINYYKADITAEDVFRGNKYDGITAYTLISHLRKEKDVRKAIQNVYNALNDNGLFLWYELVSKSHYINMHKDTQGFNDQEFRLYTEETGFKEVARTSFSRTIWIGEKQRSLYYSATEHNIWFLEILSKILPLRPTITIRIYEKKKRIDERSIQL